MLRNDARQGEDLLEIPVGDDVNWKMMPQEAVDAVYDLLMKRGDL
jgi:hypothetical protein